MKENPFPYRWLIVIILLAFIFLGLVGRIIYLGSVKSDFLKTQGSQRVMRKVASRAYRGKILDREGNLLAISVEAPAVWVNPKQYSGDPETTKRLSQALGKPFEEIDNKIRQKDKEFVYLKRLVTENERIKIKELKISGVFLENGYRRFYPEGESMAPLLGITNIDDIGQEGIELVFENWLRGKPGKNQVAKDCLGNAISSASVLKPVELGKDLVISLDRRLQYFAYVELKKVVEDSKAEAGIIVALSVKTGEILAMVNYPSFDPNLRFEKKMKLARNRAVTDLYEPGSTFKTFTMLEALLSNKYNEKTLIDTNPGEIRIGRQIIKDSGKVNNGILNFTEVLAKSSDIGTAKIILNLDAEKFLIDLRKLGFGKKSTNLFPGEASGILPNNLKRRPFVLATLSFGYSISLTALQLASAYATIGSLGVKRTPTLLHRDKILEEQIFPATICLRVINMLEEAVNKGTGFRAKIKGYRVAGKTGTSHMVSPKGGYYLNRYYASFCGIAPVSSPEIAMAVVIIDPKTKHFGSQIAAPLFSKVMEGMLRILNIKFDVYAETVK